MEKESIHGKMADAIKVNIFTIKSTVLEFIYGLMGEDIKDIGKMGKDKEEENISCRMDQVGKEYGIKIKE